MTYTLSTKAHSFKSHNKQQLSNYDHITVPIYRPVAGVAVPIF